MFSLFKFILPLQMSGFLLSYHSCVITGESARRELADADREAGGVVRGSGFSPGTFNLLHRVLVDYRDL